MAEFELFARDGEEIEVVTEIPAAYTSQGLAGSTGIMGRGSFGNLLFWHHKGEGFDIWKSVYDIRRDATVTGVIHRPVLELATMYENSFDIDWKDIIRGKLDTGKIEMYYAPGTENNAKFKGGMRFSTFDVHFESSMLQPYAKDFPLLDAFLKDVAGGKPARLFNAAQFLCPRMNEVMREMIEYSFIDVLAPRYFDSYVNILLILLLERISGFNPGVQKFSDTDRANAIEAKRILTMERTNENDEAYTINKLCRRLGTNPYKLKSAFKYYFKMSIGKYKKMVFMDYAQQLLINGKDSIDEVAMKLGYGTAQSFSTAFKNHFKYTPGYIRKKKL